jgi:outer membrane protein TolC
MAAQRARPPASPAESAAPPAVTVAGAPAALPPISFAEALAMARRNNPDLAAAVANATAAAQGVVASRSVMLPNITFNGGYLYTEGNDTPSARFIANNGVHEYIAQGDVHQEIYSGGAHHADYRRAQAQQALAEAQAEIARRGLNVTVTQAFYSFLAATHKLATADAARREAADFVTLSQRLEQNGEAAHADVIKAQLQYAQRDREMREAQLAEERSRLDLAVLLFPDFREDFTLVDDSATVPPLLDWQRVQDLAAKRNPQIAAAQAALRAARAATTLARAEYFPNISFDYWYGLDAPVFATEARGIPWLGYAAQAMLKIPVWNWGATRSRVRAAQAQQHAAQVELTATQREAMAGLRSTFEESAAARDELQSLQQGASLATESLRLTMLRYANGDATALEVVDAQASLAAARNALDDGEVRYRVSLAGIQTYTGVF